MRRATPNGLAAACAAADPRAMRAVEITQDPGRVVSLLPECAAIVLICDAESHRVITARPLDGARCCWAGVFRVPQLVARELRSMR